MRTIDVPFNISLLHLTPEKLSGLKQITSLNSTEGASSDFHPDGLFSTRIFGKVGDRRRELLFAYIDIKVTILHPLIYKALVTMRRDYAEIMAGRRYATFNKELGEFEASTPTLGSTGYNFFISHFNDIKFTDTGSTKREQFIKLINKYRNVALTDKIVVMPAGLRDLTIYNNGKKEEDEVNGIYRKFITIANSIDESAVRNNVEIVDNARYALQRNFNLLYEYLENMVKGKKKLFNGHLVARRIQNGTRNVITASNPSVKVLGGKGNPTFNSTIMGLFQFSASIAPVTLFKVRELLQNTFFTVDEPSNLVDTKTLKSKSVVLPHKVFDQWGTNEGLRRIIGTFKEEAIRDMPIMVGDYYLGLLYLGPDMTFKFIKGIDEIPEGRSKSDVRPITLCDLLFLALYKEANTYPTLITRYPVTGLGSIYPSMVHLRVTARSEHRKMLDDFWNVLPEEYDAYEFPIQGSGYINSLIPHPSHLGRLGADFDGDTSSANTIYATESKEEIAKFLKTKKAYVGTDGSLLYDIGTDTIKFVLENMTGNPIVYKPLEYKSNKIISLNGKKYNLDVIYSQLEEGRTRPLLFNKLKFKLTEGVLSNDPILVHQLNDEWIILDGEDRALGIKQKGKHWAKVYVATNEHLEKALVT